MLCASLLLFVACTARQIRSATYPRDFHYITHDEIQGTMGMLALQINALEEIMQRTEGRPGPEDHQRVIEILSQMRTLASGLKTAGRSNHPRIDRAAPRLQQDIQRALETARLDPPDYYHAGRVAGACQYCHVPRHEGAGS